MFKPTNDHLREPQPAPQSTPSMHQTPLYVLMTSALNRSEVITLPEGELLKGLRSSTSIEANAFHIINSHVHGFAPKSGKWIMNTTNNPFGMAYLAQRVHEKRDDLHGMADYRKLSPLEDIPEHDQPLELHSYRSLLARIALANLEERMDMNGNPRRTADEAFLRTYGQYILRQDELLDLAI